MKMNHSQREVYCTLKQSGPLGDHELVPLMRDAGTEQSSSGIRTRRSELCRMDAVEALSSVTMPSGREALVWSVV